MKSVFCLLIVFVSLQLFGQNKTAEYFGYRHIQLSYENDSVDVLIKSKKGEELIEKPIFLFCQGSLPQPLIKYDERGDFGVFPFNPDSLCVKCHLVIISKPYIPVVVEAKLLTDNYTYIDSTGRYPKKYSERNYLNYYVNRNIDVISYLQKQNWVSKKQLIVAGHSEGSTVAAKMAQECSKVTHLIYASGNPMGRITSIIAQDRQVETNSDSTRYAEFDFDYWSAIVKDSVNKDDSNGDTYKVTYDFSIPPINYLEKLKIPVLVVYGTKDFSTPYNDFLRVDMIRRKKTNFSFKAYVGCEHNFFPLKSDGKPDYSIFNWNKVADDWNLWLRKY